MLRFHTPRTVCCVEQRLCPLRGMGVTCDESRVSRPLHMGASVLPSTCEGGSCPVADCGILELWDHSRRPAASHCSRGQLPVPGRWLPQAPLLQVLTSSTSPCTGPEAPSPLAGQPPAGLLFSSAAQAKPQPFPVFSSAFFPPQAAAGLGFSCGPQVAGMCGLPCGAAQGQDWAPLASAGRVPLGPSDVSRLCAEPGWGTSRAGALPRAGLHPVR